MGIDLIYDYAISKFYNNFPTLVKDYIMPYFSKFIEKGNDILLNQLENTIPAYISNESCNKFVYNNLCESINVMRSATAKNVISYLYIVLIYFY